MVGSIPTRVQWEIGAAAVLPEIERRALVLNASGSFLLPHGVKYPSLLCLTHSMNTLEPSAEYSKIAEELIRQRADLHYLEGVRIAYLASDQEKKRNGRTIFGECRKVSPQYSWCCPFDFMITIYEPNTALYQFDDDLFRILLWHELSHCGVEETDAGLKFYLVPHDVEDFNKIIDAAGMHWAAKNLEGADLIG